MNSSGRSVGVLVFGVLALIAVRVVVMVAKYTPPTERPTTVGMPADPQKTQTLVDMMKASIDEMKAGEHLRLVIELPEVEGWTHGEVEPFETPEDGFSIPFEHESGLGCNLYQFTRGHEEIPANLKTDFIAAEFERTKAEIDQVVKMGVGWESAKLVKSEIVKLGDAEQEAYWAQYELGHEGKTLISDIYLWTRQDRFLKVRCTSRESGKSNDEVLKPLLTALGKAEKAPPPVLRLKGTVGK